jgi:hypothetical protein
MMNIVSNNFDCKDLHFIIVKKNTYQPRINIYKSSYFYFIIILFFCSNILIIIDKYLSKSDNFSRQVSHFFQKLIKFEKSIFNKHFFKKNVDIYQQLINIVLIFVNLTFYVLF